MTVARVAARAVDMVTILFCTLAVILLGLAPLMSAVSDRVAPAPWGRAFAATVLVAVVATVYEVAFLVARGQTPGKDLFKLRVVDATTGSPPRLGGAIRRTLPFTVLRLVPGAVLGSVIVVVLGVSAPFDARRRGIHDRIAGTLVERYDADLEEGPPATVDRAALSRTYGPRSIWELITKRGGNAD